MPTILKHSPNLIRVQQQIQSGLVQSGIALAKFPHCTEQIALIVLAGTTESVHIQQVSSSSTFPFTRNETAKKVKAVPITGRVGL
jgi:hypothetical protein